MLSLITDGYVDALKIALNHSIEKFDEDIVVDSQKAIADTISRIAKMDELITNIKEAVSIQNNTCDSVKDAIDILKQKCFDYLKSQNLDSLKSGDSTLKIAKNPPKIVIHGKLAEQQLLKDDRFVSMKREINKSAIKDFLLNNEMFAIQGEGGENLAEIISSERLDIK